MLNPSAGFGHELEVVVQCRRELMHRDIGATALAVLLRQH